MSKELQMDSRREQDCAVCLQRCQHPAELPCGHVFCFLCVKGVAFQSRKCAMCRTEIPHDYLDNPVLLEDLSSTQPIENNSEEKYQWYYEGRNGWWKYDERSNNELETAYNAGETTCTLLLAGALYIVDFQALTQVRRSDQTRRRRVKRDTPLFPAKGIAGIKTDKRHVESKNDDEENSNATNPHETDSSTSVPEENTTNGQVAENDAQLIDSQNEGINYIVDRFGVIVLDDGDDGDDVNNATADDI